jgi:hypothetical protein
VLLMSLTIGACCRTDASGLTAIPGAPAASGPAQGPVNVSVAPQALDFGKVVVHTQVSLPVTLTNALAGPGTVTLSAVQGPGASLFSVSSPAGSVTVPGSQTLTLTVTFAPLQAAATPSTASFSITECQGCAAVVVSLTGQGVASGLTITPDPLAFGFSPPAVALSQSIQLANIANQPIKLTAPSMSAGHPVTAFVIGTGAPVFPMTLAPGQTASVPVVFTPPGLGQYTGSLTFFSNDPGAPQVAVPLSGTGGGPQIQCVPNTLSFGQVAVGVPVTQQVLCTNVGETLGLAAANLILNALTVPDNAAFTAHFAQTPPAAGLAGGQSILIDVVYAPLAAETDAGHLHIANNDSQTPDLVVPLSGIALGLPPCDDVVAPGGGLVFGVVQPGQTMQLPFEISNQGAQDCLVNGLQLVAGTSPVFTLPNGPVSSQILGFAGNPQGLASTLTVPVQFAPVAAGTFAGNVAFTISNPTAPQVTVPLSGESGPSCLVITPSSIDFGVVNQNPATNAWCSSLARNVELLNTCTSDLHVTSISIGGGTGAGAQFVISGQPAAYPATIPAGGAPLTFQVAFDPTGQGLLFGTAAVMLQELPQGPYVVPLQGDAEPNGQETDSFTVQAGAPQVDLLFVMDNDDDTDQYPSIVLPALPAFFAAMPADIDLHMALTDDDYCTAAGADHGSFEPCANCQYKTNPADATTTTVFTSQNPNAQTELEGLIPHPDWNCAGEGGDEHMFDGFYLALQPNMLTGVNAGFLRPNAYLAILEIDDDSEDDLSPTLGSVQAYYDFLVGVKGDASLVSYSYVNQGLSSIPGGSSARVSQLVQMSGGVESDLNTNTWITDLIGLWTAATGLGQSIFPLNGQPVASTVVVNVNGVAVPAAQWTYNPVNNAIDFVSGSAPGAGQTVTVTYTTACN